MNTIPLVKGNTQEEINTSLIALKKALDEMNSSSSKTDASVQSQIKQINELIENINTQIEDLQPVDSVTSGNMHSVTSNAVAEKLEDYQSKEWKLLDGYNISGIEYDEIAVSVYFEYNNKEVVYSQQYSKGMLGSSQILNVGGYYFAPNDFGLCNLNSTNGLIELRNVIYAGQNFTTVSGLKIRYR